MSFLDVSDAFWSRHLWLPADVTWGNMTENDDPTAYTPRSRDLLVYGAPIAFLIVALRYLVVLYVAKPLARYFSLHEDRREVMANQTYSKLPLTSNNVLEAVYRSGNRNPSTSELQWLAREVNTSEMNVANWFSTRRKQDHPSLEQRFVECVTRALYYFTMQSVAFAVLWDKPWLWSTRLCWEDYPNIAVEDSLFFLYMLHFGANLASAARLLLTNPWPADFTPKMTHLLTRIALLGISWSGNLARFGSLVLLCQDGLADLMVELSKATRLIGLANLANMFYLLAGLSWFVIRLIFFPFSVIRSLLVEAKLGLPIYTMLNFLAFTTLASYIGRFIDMVNKSANRIFSVNFKNE